MSFFWQILQFPYDSRLVGVIIFASQVFIFSVKKKKIQWVSWRYDICWGRYHLETNICRPGHQCSSALVHYNGVYYTFNLYKKQKLLLGYCSWPYCDLIIFDKLHSLILYSGLIRQFGFCYYTHDIVIPYPPVFTLHLICLKLLYTMEQSGRELCGN